MHLIYTVEFSHIMAEMMVVGQKALSIQQATQNGISHFSVQLKDIQEKVFSIARFTTDIQTF